jgi:hypothetical protein
MNEPIVIQWDSPPISNLSSCIYTRPIDRTSILIEESKSITLEMYIPLGPRSVYGLLSGKIEPSNTESSNIVILYKSSSIDEDLVPINNRSSIPINSRIGIPEEYIYSIQNGCLDNIPKGYKEGRYAFNIYFSGAYNYIYSNNSIFYQLASKITNLLLQRK